MIPLSTSVAKSVFSCQFRMAILFIIVLRASVNRSFSEASHAFVAGCAEGSGIFPNSFTIIDRAL